MEPRSRGPSWPPTSCGPSRSTQGAGVIFELKPLTREAIPKALEKAERYRLLKEPAQAESICLDVLQIHPGNQQALVLPPPPTPSPNWAGRARSSSTRACRFPGSSCRTARQLLSAWAGSLRSRYRSAFSSALGIASRVSGLSSKITPAPCVLRDGPQEVGGHDGPRERGSIAEDDDERGQVFDLKSVVERVAKAMGPVKERQRDEDEEVESRHRVPDQAEDGLVARGVHPSERNGQPGQQDVDGEEERGHRSTGAEQEPQKRRERPRHLSPSQHHQ